LVVISYIPGVAPTITSADTTTFRAGEAASFQVTATGYPTPTVTEVGVLPTGVTLSSSALLSGTTATGTAGTYGIVVTASNTFGGVDPSITQAFTLTVLAGRKPGSFGAATGRSDLRRRNRETDGTAYGVT